LLATVANNVNQLARSANTSGQVSERRRLEWTLNEVDQLLVDLREVHRPAVIARSERRAILSRNGGLTRSIERDVYGAPGVASG
jgi:hypothetical protein